MTSAFFLQACWQKELIMPPASQPFSAKAEMGRGEDKRRVDGGGRDKQLWDKKELHQLGVSEDEGSSPTTAENVAPSHHQYQQYYFHVFIRASRQNNDKKQSHLLQHSFAPFSIICLWFCKKLMQTPKNVCVSKK